MILTLTLITIIASASSPDYRTANTNGIHAQKNTAYQSMQPPSRKDRRKPRNVIMMISDGFGPASQTMARNYNQAFYNVSYGTQLPLDTILVGSSRTRSSSSLITDSAAGATAFSCGLKSYNGAIGVDQHGKACGTVLEAAKRQGMLTGLVVTSRITHATPAAFSAHVLGRNDEVNIKLMD